MDSGSHQESARTEHDMNEFSKALNRERLKVGLGTTILSKKIGRSKSYVTQMENHNLLPNDEVVQSLADVLGIDSSVLFEAKNQDEERRKSDRVQGNIDIVWYVLDILR